MMEPRTSWGYMPLYIADYDADTAHLSTLEHGAYFLLIKAYWRSGSALPDSDFRLANIAHLSIDEWKAIKPTIMEFFRVEDGRWIHKRIEYELSHFLDKSAKARSARQAGIEKKRKEREAREMALFDPKEANGRLTDVERPPMSNGRSTSVTEKDPGINRNSFVSGETGNGRSTDVQRKGNYADADADALILVVNDLLPATEVLTDGRTKPAKTVRPSDPNEISLMRQALHGYMSMAGSPSQRTVQPPDDAIVVKCLKAKNGASMKTVIEFLGDRYQGEQSPKHANGPKSYAWFIPVIAEKFGGAH